MADYGDRPVGDVPQFDGTLAVSVARLEAYLAVALADKTARALHGGDDGISDLVPVEHVPAPDDSYDLVLGDLRLVSEQVTGLAKAVLSMAREVLIEDGYFTADQVGDDIAPRIAERLAAAGPVPDEQALSSPGELARWVEVHHGDHPEWVEELRGLLP